MPCLCRAPCTRLLVNSASSHSGTHVRGDRLTQDRLTQDDSLLTSVNLLMTTEELDLRSAGL